MSHLKHTTILSAEELDDAHIVIISSVGTEGLTYPHKMPKLALGIRAAEYGLDPEDPFALDLVMREHLYPWTDHPSYEVNGVHPLFYLPSVTDAVEFMRERIEEVRVDRLAPPEETGNRMLAGAVANKVASKGLVRTRDHLLKATDKRLINPVQDHRDALRERLKNERQVGPAERFLRHLKRTVPRPPTTLSK